MIPRKLNQRDQGLWAEQGRRGWLIGIGRRCGRNGKVRPAPGQGEQETILTAQDHPGFLLAPEDAADVSPLPTDGALLSQDRSPRSLKCNIRCRLFGG